MSQELDRGGGEHTFLCLNKQPVLQKALEHLSDMAGMLCRGLGEHQDVIQIDHDEDVQKIPQHVIDQGLENSGALVNLKGMARYSK